MRMMKFNKSERIQNYCYPTTLDFINDAIETILDEDNYESSVNIISDINTTTELLEFIISSNLEHFNFDVQIVDIRDEIEDYMITILDIGEVYVEPAINKDNEYYDLDGFIFAHKNVNSDAYNRRNRNCDTMVYSISEL